jgi:hypothetical protein
MLVVIACDFEVGDLLEVEYVFVEGETAIHVADSDADGIDC